MALRVWLPLMGTLENQGCSEIAVTNHNATVDNSGKIGKCYLLNGTNAYINGTYNATQEISFCCWANFPSIKSAHLFDARTSGGTGYQPMYVTASSIQIGASGSNYANFSQSFSNNTWYHICVTHSATEGKCYINGNLIGTSTAAKGVNMGTCAFTLGSRCNQSNYQNAKINDVRIYDHCLSAAEVHEISQGLVLHYKLDGFQGGYGNSNLCKNSRTFGTGWSGSGAITQNAFNGFAVKYKDNTSGTSYTDIAVYNSVLTVNPNEVYTVSFWAKADTAHNITCYFYNNNSGVVQSANSIASTGASGTATDGATTIALTTEWKYYWITWTFKNTGTAAAKHLLLGRNAKAQSGVSIAMVKLERGASATPWSPHPDDGEAITASIQDSSGYGHNGTINGTMSLSSNTARYNSSIVFNGSDNAIKIPFNDIIKGDDYTVSVWTYKETIGTKNYQTILGGPSGFELEARSSSSTSPLYRIHNWGGGTTAYEFNKWNLFTFVRTASDSKLYVNGELKITGTAGTIPSGNYFIGAWRSATEQNYEGLMSDFRLYATALSADDIKQLYQVGAKVDNLQNIHTFEFIEGNTPTKITKQGQLKTLVVQEAINQSLAYDKTLYTEPDGSTWIHIFHHNNPAGSRFTGSANDWSNGIYIDANKWYNVEPFLNDTLPYEFIVKQKTTSDATETKYRWIQTPNPLTATWTDVKPGTVTFITTSGYSSSSYGGMYLMKSSNLHMCIANGSNGNWFGGIGASGSYNGGIPGYPNTTVTSGYIDLYLRIYPTAKIIKNIGVGSNSLIEK